MSTSNKRSADHLDSSVRNSDKIPKLASIFQKSDPSVSTPFHWVPSGKGKQTLLHGVHLEPPCLTKVAAFDLDGTIIASTIGKGASSSKGKGGLNWQWWKKDVPAKLKEVSEAGYSILIISNQGIASAKLPDWKRKIPLIAAAIPDIPFRIFAATAKDKFRKPMPGMWYELERIFQEQNIQIDKTESFFVGDAAGRTGDFAATDRKWALNVGIPFFTPEEYFMKLPSVPFKLTGFQVSSLPILPAYTPTSTPILPLAALALSPSPAQPQPELCLLVGPPAMGKSSFYRKHFLPVGYVHVNQDTLGTRPKCVKATKEALEKGLSVVVDNTNRDVSTRKFYLDLAKSLGVSVRCFLFTGSTELAWHNNLYRAFNLGPIAAAAEPKRALVPYTAMVSFREAYEEPTLVEGFTEIKRVNFVFEGDEEERRRWGMWLQIDGK